MGIYSNQGNFENDKGQRIDYDTLRLQYISDEDSDKTIGFKCGAIKCDPDLDVIGAPDLVSLLGCPVYFVVDPNSVGVDSKGNPKMPVVATVIKAGEPLAITFGDSPSAPTEGHDKNSKKGEKV